MFSFLTDDGTASASKSNASATATKQKDDSDLQQHQQRPLLQYYQAGNHGTCRKLRMVLEQNYKCTKEAQVYLDFSRRHSSSDMTSSYLIGYRKATFCPCPGGDSPSAKRFFDALHAGCIPVVLSHDFVWPFLVSKKESLSETEKSEEEFSIRVDAAEYLNPKFDRQCGIIADTTSFPANRTANPSTASAETASIAAAQDLQSYLITIPNERIQTLKSGVDVASDHYAYYKRDKNLPNNPLRGGVLPNGGAAHALVDELGERALGVLWPACQNEGEQTRAMEKDKVNTFKC